MRRLDFYTQASRFHLYPVRAGSPPGRDGLRQVQAGEVEDEQGFNGFRRPGFLLRGVQITNVVALPL
jgi:hypothetical protein